MAMTQLVTVEEVREKLGKKGESMTDAEIKRLITLLTRLSDKAIDFALKQSGNYRFVPSDI